MTDQKNKLNKIEEQFSRQWTDEHKQFSRQSKEKVYIFDCPFSELHPEIKRRYGYDFDTYFKNNISLENTFFIYVEYLEMLDRFSGVQELKLSDIDKRANSQAYLGCTYEKMRKVYIDVVFNNEQDITEGVTFEGFVSYEIDVEGQRYCLAALDYLE